LGDREKKKSSSRNLNNNMSLQDLWSGFSDQQYEYITHLIAESDARSVCELGTFVGTTAKKVWDKIKYSNKKMYLVDNYFFLPENRREKFFQAVKNTIDPETKNLITVLQDSHQYNWQQHDFVIFGHHDAEHMIPDLEKLIRSDVTYAIIGDGVPNCFQRTKATYELIADLSGNDWKPQYYLNGLIVLGRKDLVCKLPTQKNTLFGKPIKYMPRVNTTYRRAIEDLRRIHRLAPITGI